MREFETVRQDVAWREGGNRHQRGNRLVVVNDQARYPSLEQRGEACAPLGTECSAWNTRCGGRRLRMQRFEFCQGNDGRDRIVIVRQNDALVPERNELKYALQLLPGFADRE